MMFPDNGYRNCSLLDRTRRKVDRVCAHTLAESNASARVLAKCGMTKAAETIDPDLGCLWKWEIGR